MWTSKLMVDGVWRGDILPTPEILTKLAVHAGRFHAREPLWPDRDRYHLYVSYACPFAHRVILGRLLCGLETRIGLSVLHPRWNTPHGWSFRPSPMSTPDLVNGFDHLHQLYSLDGRGYTGRVTVPVLWDRVERSIVSNDSAEILRLLSEMPLKEPGVRTYDLYPPALRRDMGEVWERDLDVVATGVYAVGGATSQEAYETSVRSVFAALDRLEKRLSDGRPFLHSEVLTASDVLLFTPAVRFDAVYHPIFRASLRRFSDYERLSAWTARMLKIQGVAATVRLDEIRLHYDDGWAPRCDGIKPLVTTEPPRTTARVAVL